MPYQILKHKSPKGDEVTENFNFPVKLRFHGRLLATGNAAIVVFKTLARVFVRQWLHLSRGNEGDMRNQAHKNR